MNPLKSSIFALAVAALADISLAYDGNCLAPLGPSVTSRNEVTTLHSYANGSHVCIHDFDHENSCAYCERGYQHECRNGWWYPKKAFPCEELEAVKTTDDHGKSGGGSSPGPGGSDMPGNNESPHRNGSGSVFKPFDEFEPMQDLCRELGTC